MRTANSIFPSASLAKLPTTFAAALCTAFLTAAVACGSSSKPAPVAPTATDEPTPTAVAPDPGGSAEPAAANPELVAKGAAIFEEYCSICHGDAGAGSKKTPAIKGPGSNEKFASSEQLLEYTKKEMPKDDPGSLSAEEYAAVVAWMQS